MRHVILFAIFGIVYFHIVENYFLEYQGVATGFILVIGGIWGLVTKKMLFKTGYQRKNQIIVVNIIMLLFGLGIILYCLVKYHI